MSETEKKPLSVKRKADDDLVVLGLPSSSPISVIRPETSIKRSRKELLQSAILSSSQTPTSSPKKQPHKLESATNVTELQLDTPTDDPKKEEILKPKVSSTSKAKSLLSKIEGKSPKEIEELTERFKNCDVVLRSYKNKYVKVTDIDHSLRLTYRKDFTENHVIKISYIYHFENNSENNIAYEMNRTVPKQPKEKSILMIKIPISKTNEETKVLNSSNPLVDKLFLINDSVSERYEMWNKQIDHFIQTNYDIFIKENKLIKPKYGYHYKFDIKTYLDKILYELPPPIIYKVKTASEILGEVKEKTESKKEKIEEIKDIDDKDIPSYLKGLPKSLILDVLNRQKRNKGKPSSHDMSSFATDLRKSIF
ncbi:hypothetical protein WA158_007712 [Blastocystis sp. Blastoise]